jgi:hypothetical protein
VTAVSQPCNRTANPSAPGELDPELKEFWVPAWSIAHANRNLSSYERNRCYLNIKGGNFLEISHISGTDDDGDTRAVVAADFRNIGMLDLIVRQAGADEGKTLMLYENRMPRKHYLMVSLRGHTSNRKGIGARLRAVVKGQQQVRELYPANTFMSQTPSMVHFGLDDAESVDTLTIRWPSGKVQVLPNVKGDRHIVIDEDKEGSEAIETVVPGRTIAP